MPRSFCSYELFHLSKGYLLNVLNKEFVAERVELEQRPKPSTILNEIQAAVDRCGDWHFTDAHPGKEVFHGICRIFWEFYCLSLRLLKAVLEAAIEHFGVEAEKVFGNTEHSLVLSANHNTTVALAMRLYIKVSRVIVARKRQPYVDSL